MRLLIIVIVHFLSTVNAYALESSDELSVVQIHYNTQQIESLFDLDKNILPANDVVSVSAKIIKNRALYSGNTLVKTFILLADVAINESDLAKAFQFASDGLTIKTIDIPLKVNLLLKIAAGYYAKGKYQKMLAIANEALELAQYTSANKHSSLALGYRATAYALLGSYQQAIADLHQIDLLDDIDGAIFHEIELMDILSIAYFYLNDYQTALILQQKILKLRFGLPKNNNIEHTYFNLARCYEKLGFFDDAYNAYWESREYAIKNGTVYHVAYAELGLGTVLFIQQDYSKSYTSLIEAESFFKGRNLDKPYLTTLIQLAKVSLQTDRQVFAYQLLQKAQLMAKSMALTSEQIELYYLLSSMYEVKGEYQVALEFLQIFNNLTENFEDQEIERSLKNKNNQAEIEKNKLITMRLAEVNEQLTHRIKTDLYQIKIIYILTSTIFILVALITVTWLKQRSKRIKLAYENIEKPLYFIENPMKTKQIYQEAYKKARKFNYPLSIGYLSVDNWSELHLRFNKKILAEVNKKIATLINEYISEFDQAGLIKDGEYLLIFPHQTPQEIGSKFIDLIEALKVIFFANLGDFSVNISFTFNSPNIQDIDPYIFLSGLCESASIECSINN